MIRALRWLWRRLAAPNRGPRALVLAACAAIVVMYVMNDDMGGDPLTPRGDGVYRPILDRGDGHMLYLMARSTALDLDWRFDNDLARFGDPWSEPRTQTGRKSIVHPIGPALVWTPLIWVAEAGAVVANALGADIPLHGYTLWHQRFVFLSSVLFACGAVLLGRRLARGLGLGRWAPSYAAVAILLGTSLTYYATYMPSYAHAMDAFACAAFLVYWAETVGRSDVRRWIVLGVLLGIATLVRVQELAMGVVVAVEVAAVIAGDLRRRAVDWRVRAALWLAGGALVVAVTAIVFVPQLVEWHVVFGKATALPQGSKFTRPGSPLVMALLFSARNGWLSTTPIAYAGVIGLGCLPRSMRLVAAGLIAAVVLQVYLASTIVDWWAGASFGQRRLCNVTLPLVVGIAALLWRCGRLVAGVPRIPRVAWHAVVVSVFGAMIAWNVWRARQLEGGKGAANSVVPMCCKETPRWLRRPMQWLYDRIGDPFEFPANAIFAIRHGVSLRQWDVTVGNYPLIAPNAAIQRDQLAHLEGSWQIGSHDGDPYALAGWSAAVHRDRLLRWTTAPTAEVIVPNLMPYRQACVLWLAPGGARDAIVRWDGDVVARAHLHDGWNAVEFTLDDPSVGEHVLAIDAAPAPVIGVEQPVGVAVNRLDLELVP